MATYKLLGIGTDAKTVKGEKKGVLTGILYMAPHTLGGGPSLCKFSTEGCRAVCLYSAGRGAFNNVQQARIRKAQQFLADPKAFVEILAEDITKLVAEAKAKGMVPAVRLNGTTDITWEDYGIMQRFPDVQFYDYTKYPPTLRKNLPPNYHLTFSWSEKKTSGAWATLWRSRGVNTAVVFNQSLPPVFRFSEHQQYDTPVINGDESDLRFTDDKGVVVGLKTKGKARASEVGAGFFVQPGLAVA